MIRVLITGAGSYIGEKAAAHLLAHPDQFDVQILDVTKPAWQDMNFAGMDAVLHVAGIAHQKETEENAVLYYEVNHKLAVAVAKKAKQEGVRQFIQLSSMSVYGIVCGQITAQSVPVPNTHYGKSKLMAEQALLVLQDDRFHVAIVRPPMVYGKDCRGNYPRLSRLVQKTPFFPSVSNERSMLYIDCLCVFLRRLLESGDGGMYFPQNSEYVSTHALVKQIALAHGKRLRQLHGFAGIIAFLSRRFETVGKVFGSLTYEKSMSSAFADEFQPCFEDTIRITEAKE